MRLKKRTKRILKKCMICCAVIAITLPVFSSFVPQNKTETIGDPQLIEELLKENADASDGGVPGEYVEGAYQVVDVTGGNTLTVLWGDVQEKVKLIGVEPVESSEENLRKLLLSDLISLEFDAVDQDEDGHLLAYAYRADGVFINRELLALGYAKLADEPENQRYLTELRDAEEAARAKSLGIWDKTPKEDSGK